MKALLALMLLSVTSFSQEKAWVGRMEDGTFYSTVHKTPRCPLAPAHCELIPIPPNSVQCPVCADKALDVTTISTPMLRGPSHIKEGMSLNEVVDLIGEGDHTMHLGDFDQYQWITDKYRLLVTFENGLVKSFMRLDMP